MADRVYYLARNSTEQQRIFRGHVYLAPKVQTPANVSIIYVNFGSFFEGWYTFPPYKLSTFREACTETQYKAMVTAMENFLRENQMGMSCRQAARISAPFFCQILPCFYPCLCAKCYTQQRRDYYLQSLQNIVQSYSGLGSETRWNAKVELLFIPKCEVVAQPGHEDYVGYRQDGKVVRWPDEGTNSGILCCGKSNKNKAIWPPPGFNLVLTVPSDHLVSKWPRQPLTNIGNNGRVHSTAVVNGNSHFGAFIAQHDSSKAKFNISDKSNIPAQVTVENQTNSPTAPTKHDAPNNNGSRMVNGSCSGNGSGSEVSYAGKISCKLKAMPDYVSTKQNTERVLLPSDVIDAAVDGRVVLSPPTNSNNTVSVDRNSPKISDVSAVGAYIQEVRGDCNAVSTGMLTQEQLHPTDGTADHDILFSAIMKNATRNQETSAVSAKSPVVKQKLEKNGSENHIAKSDDELFSTILSTTSSRRPKSNKLEPVGIQVGINTEDSNEALSEVGMNNSTTLFSSANSNIQHSNSHSTSAESNIHSSVNCESNNSRLSSDCDSNNSNGLLGSNNAAVPRTSDVNLFAAIMKDAFRA